MQLQGIRQFKTNLGMQLDEEKRQTAHFKELLQDAERQLEEANKAGKTQKPMSTLPVQKSLG